MVSNPMHGWPWQYQMFRTTISGTSKQMISITMLGGGHFCSCSSDSPHEDKERLTLWQKSMENDRGESGIFSLMVLSPGRCWHCEKEEESAMMHDEPPFLKTDARRNSLMTRSPPRSGACSLCACRYQPHSHDKI